MVSHDKLKILFGKGIIYSKVGFLFLLLVLTFVNSDAKYISENPRIFMVNSIMVPLTVALTTWLIAWNRNSEAFTKVFITFLFFFFLQVCREMSGYYAFTGVVPKTEREKEQSNKRNVRIVAAIFFTVIILLSVLALYINTPVPKNLKVRFGIETLIFTLIITFGESFTTFTHDYNLNNITFTSFYTLVTTAVVHIGLQKGGFYEHIFRPMVRP
jgi:hypothetical protein